MEITEVDVVVVGAGVAGLASAAFLAARGRSVCILESHPRPGMESSTHNSGVIHAGLYYPPGSLKARLCLQGRDALYAFCERQGVPHARTGKIVVSDDPSREGELEAIASNARTNGARVEIVGGATLRALAPGVPAAVALWSPDTGIVDASSLVIALARKAAADGAVVLTSTQMTGAEPDGDGITVVTPRERIRAAAVVNAAGLFADDVSALIGGEPLRIWPCRGDYAALTPRAARQFTRPIYPLPERSGHGLGVHITPMMDGSVVLGPTARYQDSKTDYESNRVPLDHFLAAARLLVPSLTMDDLREGGSGIRAKRHPANETFADFMIRRDSVAPRLIQAAGIDSPGLTSCLAIGELVTALVEDVL